MAAEEVIERVVITGSNIKRAASEGTSPMQMITKKEIQQTGAVTVADLMSKLPALGSSNQVDARDGGFSKGLATASLRGLGSASTLILLNGRRIAPSAYADPNSGQSTQYDLNSIPLSAIERVEILKDGASAVYGSDAIAGVINFITRSDFTGGELSANTSADGRGNFGRSTVNGAYGFGDLDKDGYNVFASVDLTQRSRASIEDARGVRTDEYRAINGRLSNYFSGISQYPVFFKEATPGDGSFVKYAGADLGCDPSQIRTGSTALVPMRTNDPLFGNKFCNFDNASFEDAQGKSDSASGLVRAEFKLSSTVTAFTEATYNRSKLEYRGVPRTISGRSLTTVFPANGPGLPFQPILPVGHPDNPTNGSASPQAVGVTYRFTDSVGGSENTNTATRLLAGIKGSHFNWDWDTGLLYNKSERSQISKGFLHLPTIEKLYKNNVSLAAISKDPNLIRNITLDGDSTITQWDLKGATEVGTLPGGKIGLAVGVEAKHETMTLNADPLSMSGQIIGIANTTASASRNVGSTFVELRTPFLKNFEMEFAGRFDKYQGFKGKLTPKVGAKWTVLSNLAVRGTYSTGFRAPSLTQMVNGSTQYFVNNYVDKLRCDKPGGDSLDCNRSFSGIAAANKDLKPETAKSLTLGVVFSPINTIDILVDYYRIKKEKEVDLMSASTAIENPNFSKYVKRNPNQGTWLRDAQGVLIPNSGPLVSVETPYINAGSTDTSGIDLELAMRNSLGAYGKLSSRLNASYMLSYKKAQNEGDPMYELVGTNGAISNDTTSVGDLPRLKGSLSTTWSFGAHSLTGTVNYIAGVSLMARYATDEATGQVIPYKEAYCEFGRPRNVPLYSKYHSDCAVSSWTTVDMAYSYAYSKQLTLGFNIQNLLDAKAPYDPNSTTTQVGGFNASMHSGKGRYFTAKANYRF
ncbi:TonB-dependent receptor [Janthinobacterium fluminis]|uniref:TonB-dependent receptor n=1 Tax=Janthinobacterium fluminis TaxID=2987524 RepID=A0ABT5JXN8_9BURK|nr:TonB-dependent receptor [Janthinobacterium fluminis]MDC8757251.1 TonB-dependent receptor [Janthinobacterium fluminis]